jgi:hypothetical protein
MATLNNVLVTCASYGAPSLATVAMLLDLRANGAHILLMRGFADVTLTRCVLASKTHKELQADESLDWVFMVDDDVSASAQSVGVLIAIALQLSEDGRSPSVSGLYLNRHRKPACAAAHLLEGAEPIPYGTEGAVIMPALCGLGCFLTPRASFIDHCNESSDLIWPKEGETVPIVCQGGPVEADHLRAYLSVPETSDLIWHGEDFDYCCREIDAGRQVVVAPVLFLHRSDELLNPAEGCIFPGLKP